MGLNGLRIGLAPFPRYESRCPCLMCRPAPSQPQTIKEVFKAARERREGQARQ